MGHVRMMAAVQPFISGAISKTVNMPEAATVEDIEQVYLEGWKLGLKAIAIYRDNSKRSQPLSTGKKTDGEVVDTAEVEELKKQLAAAVAESKKPHRRRLPAERTAVTHKFDIAGHEGYITVGLYPDGTPGEIFLKMAKEGSTVSGLMDTLATTISVALQYGVPLKDLVNKFSHVRFEPAGFTGNAEIPIAKSIVDYIFRWLGARFLPKDERDALGIIAREPEVVPEAPAISGPSGSPAGSAQASLGSTSGASHSLRQSDAPTAAEARRGARAHRRLGFRGRGRGRGARGFGRTAGRGEQERACQRQREGEREWRQQLDAAELRRHHEGGLLGQRRLAVVRRVRLDHGPQRQLLQVPQLRQHVRLQLIHQP